MTVGSAELEISLSFHVPDTGSLTHLQYLYISEILLCEPSFCDHAELFPQRTECLRLVCYHHHCLLHSTPCDLWRPVHEARRFNLLRTANAKYR